MKMHKRNRILSALWFAGLLAWGSPLAGAKAWAATNQFHGVNWADSRDNFQSGVLYISGLASSDTYATAFATGTSVMTQFMSKLGANAARMPINEATVSQYWETYTGAIDAVLAKGMVVLGYWDSAKSNKPSDMNAFWTMWKTVVDKYGGNENAYFEIFNEPNMYSKADLVALYTTWLSKNPTVPKGRVILDGTGNAQNVSDIGSASALDGCLLAVHDYSFFGSDTWTTEAQWVSQFKGEVGNYSDRTICTEWGGPMSPGSKNGISYGALDYSKSPTNYFEAYVRGMSSQLRAWKMGSFYWPGLRDGDWYSMTTRSGTGANLVLSVSNPSGLAQLQNAWTGASPNLDGGVGGSPRDGSVVATGGVVSTGGTSAGGATSGGAISEGSGGIAGAPATGQGGSATNSDASTGGRGGETGSTTGGSIGSGGAVSGSGGISARTGGTPITGGTTSGSGGSPSLVTGGSTESGGARPGGSASAGAPTVAGGKTSGCSCGIGGAPKGKPEHATWLLGGLGVFLLGRRSRKPRSPHRG